MKSATYLGFDYGTKRIGIAVGNTVSGSATALDTIMVRNDQPDWDHITRLIAEWQPDSLIVGWPIQMDNSDNPVTPRARRFGNQLHGRYNLPVHHVDERL
jgi:putative Holliday junction resolvase